MRQMIYTVVLALVIVSAASPVQAEWHDDIVTSGLSYFIKGLGEYQGALVAGTERGEIAVWANGVWEHLPTVSNSLGYGEAKAFEIFEDELWLGGSFERAAGVGGFANVAVLRDGIWVNDSSGLHDINTAEINAMAIYGGELVAGGYMGLSGFVLPQGLAVFRDGAWEGLGGIENQLYNRIYTMAVNQDTLYVAGQGGYVGYWDGTTLQELEGLPGDVFSLLVYEGELYAAGSYFQVSVLTPEGWVAAGLPDSDTGAIHAMISYEGFLYAGGAFNSGGQQRHLARMHEGVWELLDSGGYSRITELYILNEALYVGGWGDSSSGQPFGLVSVWLDVPPLEAPVLGIYESPGSRVLAWDISPSSLYSETCLFRSQISGDEGAGLAYFGESGLFIESDLNHFYYYARHRDIYGRYSEPSNEVVSQYPTGVRNAPDVFSLAGAFPNPFNPKTTIRFDLPNEREVDLRIYDATGRLVRELLVGAGYPAGSHGVEWDGRETSGRMVSAGVYFYRLSAGADEILGEMVSLK